MVSCANTVPGMLLTKTSWLLYNPMSLNASPVLIKLLCEEQGDCALSLLRWPPGSCGKQKAFPDPTGWQ